MEETSVARDQGTAAQSRRNVDAPHWQRSPRSTERSCVHVFTMDEADARLDQMPKTVPASWLAEEIPRWIVVVEICTIAIASRPKAVVAVFFIVVVAVFVVRGTNSPSPLLLSLAPLPPSSL